MTCSRCGSDRLFQFGVSPSARVKPAADTLPLVCRGCGQISIGGAPVSFPAQLEEQAKDMAELAIDAGAKGRKDLEADPSMKVERYMSGFYRNAYLDGFFRALAFFRHNAKEGRIIRLRNLWSRIDVREEAGLTHLSMPSTTYTEMEQLIHLSATPEG